MESVKVSISVRDVNLWFGEFQALRSINMEIYKNSVLAFIGLFRMREKYVP